MPEREFSRREILKITGGLTAAAALGEQLMYTDSAHAQTRSFDIPSEPIHGYQYGKEITLFEAGKEIDLGIPKKFLPVDKKYGIPPTRLDRQLPNIGQIWEPNCIVLHTTANYDRTAKDTYNYFRYNQTPRPAKDDQGRPIRVGVAAHFAIGKGGDALQMTPLYENGITRAYAVHDYPANLSMELTQNGVYNSRYAAPEAQFEKTVALTMRLMEQYNIPLGKHEYNWQAKKNGRLYDDEVPIPPGVYGHYQLNPLTRSDPGRGFLRDVRSEIKHRLSK